MSAKNLLSAIDNGIGIFLSIAIIVIGLVIIIAEESKRRCVMKHVKRKKLWFLGLIISLTCALYFTVRSNNLHQSLKEAAEITYVMDELDALDAEYGTMSVEKRAERSRRIREWLGKFDDFTARQDAFHEKMMAETDMAISLISRFAGAVLNLVPDGAEDKLRQVVAERADEEGASPSAVIEFMNNAERTTENPFSVASDLQDLADSANSEQDLQQLSEEHKRLMAELKEILSP